MAFCLAFFYSASATAFWKQQGRHGKLLNSNRRFYPTHLLEITALRHGNSMSFCVAFKEPYRQKTLHLLSEQTAVCLFPKGTRKAATTRKNKKQHQYLPCLLQNKSCCSLFQLLSHDDILLEYYVLNG